MKICLVPYPINYTPVNMSRTDKTFPCLSLGVLTISALLDQAGHAVTIVDPVWETYAGLQDKSTLDNPYYVAQLIHAKAPDLVGFSTILRTYPLTIKWAELFRCLSPETPIVLGGPQATATDEQTLRAFPWIDMVLRGEAENSIIPLLTCLQSKGNLASVPGLTWRNGGQVIRNPDAPIVTDLDTLPTPAYHLSPIEQITQLFYARTNPNPSSFLVEAGRGCPFKCTFCSTSSFFQRRYRTKSVERLIHEMVSLHTQYGLVKFSLNHDLFTYNRAYVLEFCHRLREKGLHKSLKWDCSSRIDTVDQEILAEMAAAGCSGIFYGIETGSQRMQRLIRKNLPIQQVRSVIKDTLSLGMQVSATFICGFPQEHREDLSASLTLAIDLVSMGVGVDLYPLASLFGSELYRTHRDTIHHDGKWTDLAYNYLSQEEQELVFKWPDVFDSFYHYETPYLNYDMLKALITVFYYYPRLLAALSREDIDVVSVFEHWTEWYHTHIMNVPEYYYAQSRFLSDFLQFLLDYLNDNILMTPNLNDIIHYHTIIERISSAPEDTPIVSERFNSDILVLMSSLVAGKQLTEEALQPATYLFWKTNGKVISKRLTPALAELLGIPQA